MKLPNDILLFLIRQFCFKGDEQRTETVSHLGYVTNQLQEQLATQNDTAGLQLCKQALQLIV